jgi:hypothetical protein
MMGHPPPLSNTQSWPARHGTTRFTCFALNLAADHLGKGTRPIVPRGKINRERLAHGLAVQTQPFLEVGTSGRISTWTMYWMECQARGVLITFRKGFSVESSRPASLSTTLP